eukprot:1195375-Prymnesium_polylepis.1
MRWRRRTRTHCSTPTSTSCVHSSSPSLPSTPTLRPCARLRAPGLVARSSTFAAPTARTARPRTNARYAGCTLSL